MKDRPFVPVDEQAVVEALARSAPRWRVPSKLAEEILAPDKVGIVHARGVLQALRSLESRGVVKEKGKHWPDSMKFQLAP